MCSTRGCGNKKTKRAESVNRSRDAIKWLVSHYIVSRLRSADAVINSFLPYELPVLKARLGGRRRRTARTP
jgi:hypothetical protein